MSDPVIDPYVFDLAQDNSGMDAGIGIPECTLKITYKTRWALKG